MNRAKIAGYVRMATTDMSKTGSKGTAIATALGHVGGKRTIRSDAEALKLGRRRIKRGGIGAAIGVGGLSAFQRGMSPTRYRNRYGNQSSGAGGMTPRSTGGYA